MIPFFKNTFGEEEKKAISDCIDSGWVVMGKKTAEFEEKFADYVGSRYAVFVDSGTSALFLAMRYQMEKFGRWFDEIETPSLTFVSDAEIIVNLGCKPKFVDVSKTSLCVENWIEASNHPTLAVHLTGNRAFAPATVYDSAHRIEKDDVKDSKVPWCYSFYATKNMSTVQGGMIALNDKDGYDWLKKARDHGISKGTLERYTEKTPTYSVDFVGYRMKADDLRAVIGLEQLKKLPAMTERRNEIVARYNRNLGYTRTGNHLYPILVSNREKFFEYMSAANVQCSVHFKPLHLMPAFKGFGGYSLPNTEYLGERLVSLPLFPDMTDEQIDYISQEVLKTHLLTN
jgi:dTDP-4-amino-4,6-dideoxygalactose transaminase